MASRCSARLLAGLVAATACAPDYAAPGYDDPTVTAVTAAAGGAGSSPAPADGSGGSSASPTSDTAPGPTTTATAVTTAPSTTASSPPPSAAATGKPATADCDLGGRWLVTDRSVEEGLGVQQALRHWFYFEFSQDGEQVLATRGLDCAWDVVPLSAIAGAADLHKAWPRILAGDPMAGRKGTIKAASAGCTVAFEPYVSVYGATVAYYKDTSRPLPGPNDQGAGGTPGWEDWDADGNPGITYNLSGIATGQVFYSSRQVNTWAGTISRAADSFVLSNTPKHEASELGYNGSPLLTTQSTTSANASLHFVQFARLDPTQATGDDAAACSAVRTLAATLTPKADEKPIQ